jgi:multicomponent Na+:H+ antiporter subunit F
MMFTAAGAVVLIAILLFLMRALLGPTAFDRILAVNAIGTKTVVFVALLGFMAGRPDFLDIALLYALINFIATLAVLKFVEYRHLD